MGVTHHLEPLITTVQTNLQTCKIYLLMHFRGGALSSKKLDLQIKDLTVTPIIICCVQL